MKRMSIIAMIAIATALPIAALAQTTQRTFQDSMGRNVGRSVTDTKGHTTYYDNMGRTTGRAATDSRGNATFYDAMGRNTGRATTSGKTTTTYDSMGRQTGTIRSR